MHLLYVSAGIFSSHLYTRVKETLKSSCTFLYSFHFNGHRDVHPLGPFSFRVPPVIQHADTDTSDQIQLNTQRQMHASNLSFAIIVSSSPFMFCYIASLNCLLSVFPVTDSLPASLCTSYHLFGSLALSSHFLYIRLRD